MTDKRPTPVLPRLVPGQPEKSLEQLNRAVFQEFLGYSQSMNSVITRTVHQDWVDFYRDAAVPIVSTTTTTYGFPGAALTASTIQWYAGSFTGRRLKYARWLLAWNPQAATAATAGVRLIHADAGPTNITQFAEITRGSRTTPIVDAVEVTTELNALLDAQVNKTIAHQARGDGTAGCDIYLSELELVWDS